MTRLFDIILSSLALITLLPLLAPLALLLSCTGEGKVFYKQERIGKGKKRFKLVKFATMLEDSPNLPGGDITSWRDPRVLPLGKYLRITKINELPQLFNILVGDISIVGPRPLTFKNFDMYDVDTQKIISKMRPGLTGVGSIVFRDEESILKKSPKDIEACYREDIAPFKGELESWYFMNQSIFLYFNLIFLTIWAVISPKSVIIWKLYPNMPELPECLRVYN